MGEWLDYGKAPSHSAYTCIELLAVRAPLYALATHVFSSIGRLSWIITSLLPRWNPPPLRIVPAGQSTVSPLKPPGEMPTGLPSTICTFGFTAPPANLLVVTALSARSVAPIVTAAISDE